MRTCASYAPPVTCAHTPISLQFVALQGCTASLARFSAAFALLDALVTTKLPLCFVIKVNTVLRETCSAIAVPLAIAALFHGSCQLHACQDNTAKDAQQIAQAAQLDGSAPQLRILLVLPQCAQLVFTVLGVKHTALNAVAGTSAQAFTTTFGFRVLLGGTVTLGL